MYWTVAAGSALGEAKWSGRRFLFNVTETRGGVWPPRLDGIQLLQDGCSVLQLPLEQDAHGSLSSGESWILFNFDEDVAFNGFALAAPPADSDPARDPVKFALFVDTSTAGGNGSEGGGGAGAAWAMAGASGWRWSETGGLQLRPELPLTGAAPAVVDMRAPWWWLVAKLVPSVVSRHAAAAAAASRARRCCGRFRDTLCLLLPTEGRSKPWPSVLAPRVGPPCWPTVLALRVGPPCWPSVLALPVGPPCWPSVLALCVQVGALAFSHP